MKTAAPFRATRLFRVIYCDVIAFTAPAARWHTNKVSVFYSHKGHTQSWRWIFYFDFDFELFISRQRHHPDAAFCAMQIGAV